MPAGDGTGPLGFGPMTGRAAGYCAGYSVPGYMNPMGGRGFGGWGRGGGRGWRHRFHATGLTRWQQLGMGGPAYMNAGPYGAPYATPVAQLMAPAQELDALKGQEEYLADALEGIKKRIDALESQVQKPAQ